MGETVRSWLKREHNIDCEVIWPARKIDPGEFTFTAYWASLYRYRRVSTGETLWLLEMQVSAPPDIVYYRTWVLDAEPTDNQILLIAKSDAQAGSQI